MSLLTSAIKGLAGVAKSDALKEAERLLAPKPGFYSKLEEAITGLNFTKMPSQQLRKTMEGRQVSPLEYDNVLGQMEGTVSKEEVMGMIGKNKTELKDVVLGEPRITEKVNMSPDRAYGLYKEGMISADDYAQAEKTGFIEKSIKRPVHYEQYSEPGYVPGSYRERFVTVPPKEGQIEWRDGHSAYSNIHNPVVRIRYNDRIVDLPKESYSFTDWKNKVQKAYPDETHTDKGWNKLYKISNGTMSNKYIKGKRILFVEEMQGPSKENQDKMPEYLRKRIYDIGVKRVLALAKEKGYDGVAWTTGEMQASRYDLSKQISNVEAYAMANGMYYNIFANDLKGIRVIAQHDVPVAKLPDLVGKELAEKIVNSKYKRSEFSGLDLKVGGEGLKYLYDKQLPSLFKKYGKGDVKELKLRTFDGVEKESKLTSVPYLPITEKTPSRHPIYSMIPPTLAGMTAMYRTGEGNAQ
jgi:hypothetical protein